MLVIGDVHGKYDAYKRIIEKAPASIQVGDMGVGFIKSVRGGYTVYAENPPHYKMVPGHKFIRGNHDNPSVCRRHSQWIPDGTIDGEVMFVGGAYSIDRAWRTEGYTWWPDEQNSYEEFSKIMDDYLKAKPKVMITHDCPQSMAEQVTGSHHKFDITRTGQAFDQMWQMHAPDLWIFGHHHVSFDQTAQGTRFVCLAELEAREFYLPLENITSTELPKAA